MRLLISFGVCLSVLLAARAAAGEGKETTPPPLKPEGGSLTPAASSPSRAAQSAFVAAAGTVFYRILPAGALNLVHEEAIVARRAQRDACFVPMQMVNRGTENARWRDGHDLVKITLHNGEELTSEEATHFIHGGDYPWGYTHIGDLVAPQLSIPPSEECVKLLCFRGRFSYNDIAAAEMILGLKTIKMQKVALKKRRPQWSLPKQRWRRVPVAVATPR